MRKTIGSRKVPDIPADIALRMAFETCFGIYNHDAAGDDRPLALVAAHPKEDYGPYSRLYHQICDFIELGIHQKTGMDLVTYLNQPTSFNTLVKEAITLKAEADKTKETNALAKAQQNFGQPKPQQQQKK